MKKLNKKQQILVINYDRVILNYGERRLEDCYKKASEIKKEAQKTIRFEMSKINKSVITLYATGYTVVSFNCNFFSCAYAVYDWKIATKDKLVRRAIVYHTAYNRYIIPFDDTIVEELQVIFNS